MVIYIPAYWTDVCLLIECEKHLSGGIFISYEEELIQNLAVNLRRLRLQKGLTQKQLAEMAGISVGYLSDIENAKRLRVRVLTVMRLTETLETMGGKVGGEGMNCIGD